MSSFLFQIQYQTKRRSLLGLGVFSILACFLAIFPSTADAILYAPGETLEPACAPGSPDCGVLAPAISGANSDITSLSGLSVPLSVIQGGTGFSSFQAGDFLYAFTSSTMAKLAIGTTGKILKAVDGLPAWGDADVGLRGDDYVTTGLQDDVNLGVGSFFRYAGAGAATFTGFAGGVDGRQIHLLNASSFTIAITNQDTSSVDVNRIAVPSGSSMTIPPLATIILTYEAASTRWHVVTITLTPSSVADFTFLQNGNAYGVTANIGTTDANGFNILTSGITRFGVAASSATLTGTGPTAITTNSTLTLSSATNTNFTATAGGTGTLSLDTGTTGAIQIGTGANAKTITIGNTTGSTALYLQSGTGGIHFTGLTTLASASAIDLSVYTGLSVGESATSTISGDNGLSTLQSDLLVTGSTTLQAVMTANVTTTGTLYATTLRGDAQNTTLARIGNSTFSTLQDLQNVFHSAGWTSGGVITDVGGGVVNVAEGTGLLRSSDSAVSTVYYIDWSASLGNVIPLNTNRYVGVEYNNGSPRVTLRTSADWNYATDFPLGVVTNDGGTIHIANDVQGVGDHAAKMIRREYETMPLSRDERDGGLMLMESNDNMRHLSVTGGALWDRLNRYTIAPLNTALSDTFDSYTGVTRQATGQTQWDNTSYDNGGTLTALAPGKYAVLWFYVETDGDLVAVYGTNQYNTLAAATVEMEPTVLPNRLITTGKLIGQFIFQRSATVAADVNSAFGMNQFMSQSLTHLSNLSDLDFASSGLTGFVGTDGVSGGQTIIGGTAGTDGLTLQSTTGTATTDFIKFLVGTNGGTEAARFIDNGNFGIGTTTPSAKLTVNGEALADNFTASSLSATSSFAGPVTMANTLTASGLAMFGTLTATGNTALQNLTGTNSIFTQVTTTNLVVSTNSQLGAITVGTWNGTAVDPTFGGTGQTTWTKGDVLFASDTNVLARLPIGSAGTVLTVGGSGVPTWAAGGAGSGGSSPWTTSTDSLMIFPGVPTSVVVIGGSATTTGGFDENAILEVTGNSYLAGTTKITGLATMDGGLRTSQATISGTLSIGGNATTTAAGAFATNGLITASAFGTGLSVTNDATIGGQATIGTLLMTGSSTLQSMTATDAIFQNATSTNLFVTTLSTDTFNPTNLSTGGTLTVLGHSSLTTASTTNLSVSGALWMNGQTTTTNGIVNTQTKFQIAGTDVLTANTLGTGITSSFLTSLGTLGALTVSGQTTFGNASTTNLSVSGALWMNGQTTTTNGIVNTQTKFQIAGTDVLTANTLGTGITSSSLTSLGSLGALTVSGQTTLGNVSTTGALSVVGNFSVNGNATLNASGAFSTVGTITSGLVNGQTITSSANFTGTLTAASLITASNGFTLSGGTLVLPTGSIADTALSSNVALLNRSGQAFSGTNLFSDLTTLSAASATRLSVATDFAVSGNVSTPKGTDYLTTGSQNDVDLGVGSLFRYAGAGTATFTGVAGGADGRQIRIINASSFNLIITNEGLGSLAANRVLTAGGSSVTIPAGVSAGLQYDAGVSRWRIVVLPATSGTISGFAFLQNGNAYGATANIGTTDANGFNILTSGITRFGVAAASATLTGTGATTITTNSALTLLSGAASALSITASTTGTLLLDTGTTGRIDIGVGNNTKTINLGTGTAGDTINIGTSNTVADTIAIGSALDTMTIAAGTLNITNPGAQLNGSTVLCIQANRLRLGASNTACQTSSARFKHDIDNLDLGLETINALRPVDYFYNDNNTYHQGLIAEEVYPLIPTAVILDAEGLPYALDYNEITPVIIHAIKEQSVLMGDISPKPSTSTEEALSHFAADVQSEISRDPVLTIGQKIADQKQFLTDFVVARVTALRGYFDEIFAKKVHTEKICVKKSDESEICIDGDQLNALLQHRETLPPLSVPVAAPVSVPTPVPELTPISTPVVDPTPAPEAIPAPASDLVPAPTEPALETIPSSESASAPIADSTPASESVPASDFAPAPSVITEPVPAPVSVPTPATDPTSAPEPESAPEPVPTT